MVMDKMIGKVEFILFPERGKISSQFIIDMLSKKISYYKKDAVIAKASSLSNLRKTYSA